LAGGVVIGGKSGLGAELQDAFTKTGLVQIIVLSGYNVMIVAEWMMRFVGALRVRRRRAALAGALALLLFVGIAGFSATALRATLMALIALYARATGKSYAASRALLVVVLLMLIWNPLLLPYDPGFDLSIAATAGLIWLAPLIGRYLSRVKNEFWREAIATTLAAQIAVLPLLLYETGSLSLVAVPANLMIAPVVPLCMGLAALAGIVGGTIGLLLPSLSLAVGMPAYATALYVIGVARGFAALPSAAYVIGTFSFALVLLAYAALAAAAFSKRASSTDQSTLSKKASIYLPFSAGR
jgi:competence protein ComEC